ncbi:HK97 family phage prohead protease/HK97 family phage major capsid protein,TIGR01554 [Rhizobium sp. PP-F2F-G48]|uniref:phage major capsid protein n=1 Tax=Rhizobium sp. PP-F2F-G48 TaxID=2135651 RepID=UPI0010EAC948|nr:phage major capsid protein [Rhizobium sp. PP-F2F-G48]TCM57834.1 HK97 family phage prohead protease/HK97 family phage major capsid protein,TIGR01554 [Rhizobium sp. PP-F2F-G48]
MSEAATREIKAEISIDEAGTVTGIAWPFDAPDTKGDLIEPTAFTFAPKVPMLLEHEQRQCVGIWDSMSVTDKGLEVKGSLFVDGIAPARAARERLRSRAMSGLSIGYMLHEHKARPEGGRVLTDLTITEISLCRSPVHPSARVTEVKSIIEENHMALEIKNEPEVKADPVVSPEELKALKARMDTFEAKANRLRGSNNNQPNGENDNSERKALESFMRTGSTAEVKAIASDNKIDGGYFVLPTTDLTIRSLLTDLSPLRGLAEVVTIASDTYERFYSLGKRGAKWVSERSDRPQDTATPELIKHSYATAEMYAAPTTTRTLLDDAAIDLSAWLINNAVHDFAETEGESFLAGDGVGNSPKGLLTYSTAADEDFARGWNKFQHVAAGATPTDLQLTDALIKLIAALRRPYKGNALFLMNSNTALRLRQIKDSTGRYLWAPTGNLIEGIDHPLFGFRVEIDDGMPDIGANTTPIAFGDFRQGYVIVDRQGVRVAEDSTTRKGWIIFDIYKRVGGGAGDFNAIKFLKISAN